MRTLLKKLTPRNTKTGTRAMMPSLRTTVLPQGRQLLSQALYQLFEQGMLVFNSRWNKGTVQPLLKPLPWAYRLV